VNKTIRLAILGSTNGTDMQTIIDAIADERLDASIEAVISNRSNAYILERARKHGIQAIHISHKGKHRKDFDAEISRVLQEKKVDLILLIGFMRILSKEFCREWSDHILNVHPSLLPKYAGGMDSNVHAEVLQNKEVETGCTIHFVTEQVDGGPILVQKTCPVEPDDSVASLKSKVQKLEGEAFLEAIKMIQKRLY